MTERNYTADAVISHCDVVTFSDVIQRQKLQSTTISQQYIIQNVLHLYI